jgi:hypothetical protein
MKPLPAVTGKRLFSGCFRRFFCACAGRFIERPGAHKTVEK